MRLKRIPRHPEMPADTPDYLQDAWIGCLVWAADQPEILATFEAETGLSGTPQDGTHPLTDADRKYARAFVAWVNANIWGPIGTAGPRRH